MSNLRIGWAETDLTPDQPVLISGQFHARISEGVMDPITATVCVLDAGDDHAVFVSCDLVTISDELRDGVRERLSGAAGLSPDKVVLHATHTHTAPEIRLPETGQGHVSCPPGVELTAMPVQAYVDFAADRIAQAARSAWDKRAAGSVAFGLGYAVVGRNRRWVDLDGRSTMYGNTNTPAFSHIEGYEDHGINVLATYTPDGELTGLVVNVPCTSQVDENLFVLSADFWHETRIELRKRFGASLPVLGQCSAAGDQSPHVLYDKAANTRMWELKGKTERQDIAERIADALARILPAIEGARHDSLQLRHHVETVALPLNALSASDAEHAEAEAEELRATYEQELARLEADPSLREQPRWYTTCTRAYRRMQWFRGVKDRFEKQSEAPVLPTEIHVVRLGDIAFATNRFEYYLDFGIRIKAQSPAMQTFLVQLAGPGTYVPSPRSVSGGGYGSVPASNPVGPEGGRRLADRTIEIINRFWSQT
jgi:hypothetical protein